MKNFFLIYIGCAAGNCGRWQKIPNSYLAVSRDLGSRPEDPDFAHSPYKYPLAQRVAALALAGEYGIGSLEAAYSPLPIKALREENRITIVFRCVNGGLTTIDNAPLTGFSVMDHTGTQISAEAHISAPDRVCVKIPTGVNALEVHFAMKNMAYIPQGNLCGGTLLPAPSFALPL